MIRRGPIAVAIKQCSDNATIQNSGKRLVLFVRLPFRHDLIAFGEATDAQSLSICRSATPADIVWRVFFLERFVAHNGSSAPQPARRGGLDAKMARKAFGAKIKTSRSRRPRRCLDRDAVLVPHNASSDGS